MDSSVPDPQPQLQPQPPQPGNCQPLRPFEQSNPQAQSSYYYYQQNSSQPAAGSSGLDHHNHTSSQGLAPAYQQPHHLACGAITLSSQIPEQSPAYGVPPGLNPAAAAAVAALSELSEFAGSMARQEAMNRGVLGPGVGSLHYPHPLARHNILAPGMNGRGLPRRWRGRGRGRGGHLGRGIGSSNPTPASETEISTANTRVTGPAPSQKPVPQIFWCEICTVDCSTLETLEQHKNGKRHKRTVKKFEEMQAWRKLQLENEARETGNDILRQPENQMEQVTDGERIIPPNEEKDNVQGDQENGQEVLVAAVEEKSQENVQVLVVAVEEKKNIQDGQENLQDATAQAVEEKNVQDGHQKVQETKAINGNDLKSLQQSQNTDLQCGELEEKLASEQPTNVSSLSSRGGHAGRNPSKRKMTAFGRGDKRARHSESMGKKPSERPREQPVVCTICHITCDTQAVFETHLVGRKHTSRAKNFQRQQATPGPLGYFHENPEYVHTSQGPPPIFYGIQPPEVSQQCADMQDAPLEFRTGEVQCEQASEAVAKAAVSVVPEGLNAVPDSDVEKKSDEGKNPACDGNNIKPDSAPPDAPTEGSPASKP